MNVNLYFEYEAIAAMVFPRLCHNHRPILHRNLIQNDGGLLDDGNL